MLRVDDRLVGPNDRVDVLKEDDPRRDLVRPADAFRLLLVLAEVAGRVQELLRDDRRAELHLLERVFHARRPRSVEPFEVLTHRRHIELDNRVLPQLADPTAVERDELHRFLSSQSTTSWAFRSGGKTG